MATTYYSYNIKYGGTTIWNDTTQPLQSIGIQYGGITRDTMVSATTKTLPTANKYMTSDLVIGDKTLPTNGKYMSGDISITTTVQSTSYTWLKYNAIGTTTYSERTYSWSGEIPIAGVYDRIPYYEYYTSGPSRSGSVWSGNISTQLIMYPPIGYKVPTSNRKIYYAISDVSDYFWASGTAHEIYGTTTYSKGDTLYGEVRSSNASAYPTNGYQGGYWYVKVERWEKFNSPLYYSITETGSWNPGTSGNYPLLETLYGYYTSVRFCGRASTYSFNAWNGLYTISGTNLWALPDTSNITMASLKSGFGPYTTGLNFNTSATQNVDHIYQMTSTSSSKSGQFYLRGNNTDATQNFGMRIKWGGGRRLGTSSTYVKGSTSYGYVYNTSSSAYPNNGRASDGYWYVKS